MLRVREENGRTILTYKAPVTSKRVKSREETELVVTPSIKTLLEGLGYSPVFTKEKKRSEYRLAGVTVCVDDVKHIGKWLEFEVFDEDSARARKKIVAAAKRLGIPEESLTTDSYVGLLRQRLKNRKGKK